MGRKEKKRESFPHIVRGMFTHRLHADKKTIKVCQRWIQQMAEVLAYKHTGKC